MPRVVEKRSVAREVAGSRSKIFEVSVSFVLMVVLSVALGFAVVVISLRTGDIVRENNWLRSKINELGYVLENVRNGNLEKLSGLDTLILDGKP